MDKITGKIIDGIITWLFAFITMVALMSIFAKDTHTSTDVYKQNQELKSDISHLSTQIDAIGMDFNTKCK